MSESKATPPLSTMTPEGLLSWWQANTERYGGIVGRILRAMCDAVVSEQEKRVRDVEAKWDAALRSRDQQELRALDAEARCRELESSCASRVAEARREGAREALTRYCWSDGGVGHPIGQGGDCEYHETGNCRVLHFRDTCYPLPTPPRREVVIQGVKFWYEAGKWHENGIGVMTSNKTLVGALSCADITPTADEYKALLSLAHP